MLNLDKEKLKDIALESGISAVCGYVASNFLSPNRSLDKYIIGTVGVSSVISNVTHDYILEHIPKNEKYANIESAALNAGTVAASTFLINRTLSPLPVVPSAEKYLIATAVGSSVAGSYIAQQVKPMIH